MMEGFNSNAKGKGGTSSSSGSRYQRGFGSGRLGSTSKHYESSTLSWRRPNNPTENSVRGREEQNIGNYFKNKNASRARSRPNPNQKLNFDYIVKLANGQTEPSDIIRCLGDPENDLATNLKDNSNNFDYLEAIVTMIGGFCAKNGPTQFPEGFISVVKILDTQKMFGQMPTLMMNIPGSRLTCSSTKEERLTRLVKAISHLVTEMLVMMPSFSCHCLGRNFLTDILHLKSMPSVKNLNVDDSFDALEDCIPLFETVFSQHTPEEPKKDQGKLNRNNDQHAEERASEDAPNDFRTLNVIPSWEDVCVDVEPFLRPSIVKGMYPDLHTYLDIQFRLLREDFFNPLRQGLLSFKNLKDKKFNRGTENIWIYHQVHILEYNMNKDCYTVQFALDGRLKSINWERIKRLIYGSLLCLSSDNFSSFFVFTVCDRNLSMLSEGKIQLKFEGEKLTLEDRKKTFTMIESTIFFESYRSVLGALQKISPAHFPLKDYILGRDSAPRVPAYLLQTEPPLYDLSWNNRFSIRESMSNQNDVDLSEDEAKNLGMIRRRINNARALRRVAILDPNGRLNANQLGLDESQAAAFYVALTQQISIIQGPPGTGKTYLGLRIVETLLKNRTSWINHQHQRVPILVICYTNHALDQFLEGILQFTKKIVRIGGQSNCDALKPFSLLAWKKNPNRESNRETRWTISGLYNDLCQLDRNRQIIYAKLHVLNSSGLISEDALFDLNVISQSICDKFNNLLTYDHWTVMGCWLSIYWNETLERLVHYFTQLTPVRKRNVKPSHEANRKDTASANDQYWEKDDVDEIEASRKIADDDELSAILNANQSTRDDNSILSEVFEDFSYVSRKDEEEIKRMEDFRENLEGNDAATLQFNIEELAKRVAMIRQLIEIVPPANAQQLEQMSKLELKQIPLPHRWMMYSAWKARATQILENQVSQVEEKYQSNFSRLNDARNLESVEICQTLDVVGFTTTGAAKQRALLSLLKPKIVVVEEAAEVLEAHVVCALSASTEQLILIGDHQQLRPPVTVFRLAKQFNLDVSLFERLIKNGMEPSVLSVQHRMCPDIARLIVPSIYPHLTNHPSVLRYPEVQGMSTNVFFLTHNEPEMSDRDAKSHLNPYEAEMSLALARHLIIQGIKPSQITILTTYSGQFLYLRNMRNRNFPDYHQIRIAVVDNFQGEENDVIILSLVRSNEDDNIGFLRNDNRICVALSRGKRGFYVIGNMSSFEGQSKLWNNISHDLDIVGQLGPDFLLKCDIHNVVTKARQATDFPPEGGCMEMCNLEMSCGHLCPKICHVADREHALIKCQRPCQRSCPAGHACPKKCFEKCKCVELIHKILPCSHEQTAFCHLDPGQVYCQTIVWKTLPGCGHGADLKCGFSAAEATCLEPCGAELDCGHTCPSNCHYQTNTHQDVRCQQPCQRMCAEEHPCSKRCDEECGQCTEFVLKTLPCEHTKEVACHMDPQGVFCRVKVKKSLPDCQHVVETECGRSTDGVRCEQPCQKMLCADGHQCQKKCHQPCGKCFRRVSRVLECGHSATMECYIDPSLKKCNVLRESILPPCGHLATIRCNEDPNEANCSLPCDVRLECGHTCTLRCHVNKDPNHDKYQCKKPCGRFKQGCKKDHECARKCFEECTPCNAKWKRTLPCGHEMFTECHFNDNDIVCMSQVTRTITECGHEVKQACWLQPCRDDCNQPCSKILPCGHECKKRCKEPCNEADCAELVETSVTNICGHNVVMNCNDLRASGGIPSEVDRVQHLKNCREPCRMPLDCEHLCKGTCGQCFNGRFHRPCGEKCGRTLVCGHSCDVDCSSSCPPCQRKCENYCIHSKCKQKCFESCSPCLELCPWKCVHQKCTKKCGQLCDRIKCDEPCTTVLPCGHVCAGLCGEACPPLCRICNRDELSEFILLGNETDADAKFIFLPDCGHCIEVEGMDQWMASNGDGQIQPKVCPRCKTPVRLCLRYGNEIKNAFKDIALANKKILQWNPMQFFADTSTKWLELRQFVTSVEPSNDEARHILLTIDNHLAVIGQQVKPIENKGKRSYRPLDLDDRFKIQVALDLFEKMAKFVDSCRFRLETIYTLIKSSLLGELWQHVHKLLRSVVERNRISTQEYRAVHREMERLDFLRALFVLKSSPIFPKVGRETPEALSIEEILMKNTRVLDETDHVKLKTALNVLEKKLDDKKRTGLGITEMERKEIVSSFGGMGSGHWFKCPNGHIYVITECGGAMQMGRCNECNATIGGANHALTAGNTLASEMDGARFPAWPQ